MKDFIVTLSFVFISLCILFLIMDAHATAKRNTKIDIIDSIDEIEYELKRIQKILKSKKRY
jgi:hypothetical protein